MSYQLHLGDAVTVLRTLDAGSVQTCVTSPPYFGLRSYLDSDDPAKHLEIGTEQTPEQFVARLVDVFREVRRVLRDDGTVFLNLGDSYFGGGGAHKPEHANPGLSRSAFRGGVPHVASYGTSGKALEDYQDRDCLCGNLCDVCRVVYQSHKSRNDGLLVAMLTASLSAPIRERTESANGHFPTSDSTHQASRNARAIQGQRQTVHLEGEQLRAVLVSTIGESSPRLLELCLERANQGDVCLLCARSLPDLTLEYADMSDDLEGQVAHSRDNALHGDPQESHSQCIDKVCGCYSGIGSYPYYTTPSHNLLKPKDLIGIPWMVAFALRADGWWLRSDIIWAKPNPMPESVTDRPTKSHEYIFLLSKSATYYYDADAIREEQKGSSLERLKRGWNGNGERGYPNGPQNHLKNYMGKTDEEIAALPGRNKRSVWTVTTKPYSGAHFATFPPALIEPCILAGSKRGDTVLDPFFGSGTTAAVALKHGRNFVGIDLDADNLALARVRIEQSQPMLLEATP